MSVLIRNVRRRRIVGPLWQQYDMEVLQALIKRYNHLANKGIRALGGKYPTQTHYSQ